MAVFSIAFDFKPQRDNVAILKAIEQYDCAKAFDSYWYISTKEELTPTQLYNRFEEYLTEKDIIVIQIVSDSDSSGKIHAKTYHETLTWLRSHLER